jgi:hypothetical protein
MTWWIVLAALCGFALGFGAVWLFLMWLFRGLPPGSWGPKR